MNVMLFWPESLSCVLNIYFQVHLSGIDEVIGNVKTVLKIIYIDHIFPQKMLNISHENIIACILKIKKL